MKLYYSPGACSLSPHIVLKELGLPHTLVKADVRKKVLEDGSSFLAINPKGQVPALVLDSGDLLTEGAVIVQYLSDLVPEKGLMPRSGMDRYRTMEWLNFIATEVHKGFSPLWDPTLAEEAKEIARGNLAKKFNQLEKLNKSTYLMGDTFTVADAYLFTVLSWSNYTKVTLPEYLKAYLGRVAARPAVQAAMSAEGLGKK